jgi:acetylornithine deacetylase
MPLDVVETLCELVALPSVNPMGRSLDGPEFFEYRVTDYLEGLFGRLGLPCRRQTIAPRRDNIVARLDGSHDPRRGGRSILLEAHQDTVPVDGMTIAPWSPEMRAGRVYGRGACDIKGGMAAMLAAVARLAAERPGSLATIYLACTVNEEHGYTGATALPRMWKEEALALVPRAPDGAVVAEPTQLDVVVAHKGTARWRCHTLGRATHSSQPHQGDNAIYKMARVVSALAGYADQVGRRVPSHPLCGDATLSVGTISGGLSVNTVPDRCTIEIDRRVLPGEDPLTAYRQVIDWVEQETALGASVEHEPPYMQGASLSDDHNGPLAERLAAAARFVGGRGRTIGVPFGTDASKIAAAGVPSVVFGPGSIDQAHTADEWVDVEQLRRAEEILYEFLRREPATL